MSKLPVAKPKEVVKKLKKVGFIVDHTSGSHVILYKIDHPTIVTVPMHNSDLKPGTFHSILEQAGLSIEEFLSIR